MEPRNATASIDLASPDFSEGFEDVSPPGRCVNGSDINMQDSIMMQEKLHDLMAIINSKRYSRIWACLEMIRNSIAHIVTAEYQVITETEDLLWSQVDEYFQDFVIEKGDLILAEREACDGNWPVPVVCN